MAETDRSVRLSVRARFGPSDPVPAEVARADARPSNGVLAFTTPRSCTTTISLVLDGDHVEADDPTFRDFLFDLISAGPGAAVHLDMGYVTLLDSASLGTLVTAYKGAAATGRSLQITAASKQVRAVLAITGTSSLLLAPG